MDAHSIGENAGLVWNLLSNGKRLTYEDLRTASNLSDKELGAAIGWLSREGKIYFEEGNEEQGEYLSLYINFFFF